MESLFWADKIAKEIIEKEKCLGRDLNVYRTEMGVGASGIPHVGSAGDAVRNYVVTLALLDKKVKSELFAFCDDRDGLRKVPMGFPASMEKEIGKPVFLIKDPFGCHKNFAEHFSSILTASFNDLGLKYELKRANDAYSKGLFDKEIIEILTRSKEVGKIIHKTTGQEKYLKSLPFLPICKNCKRIYTTTAYSFDPKAKKIHYKCDQEFVGKNSNTGKEILVKGCGYQGEAGIREGKLAWKAEFAARWRALKISYEAHGKDILDSVKCNDAICREILHWEPPIHSLYEMFTERGGKKISKTASQVFTPEMWLKYASPESLRLMFLKRLRTTRVVDADAIPSYMDEVDNLGRIYSGKVKLSNKKELAHLKRLYEYMHFLKPVKEPRISIPYNMLVNLLRIAKEKKVVKEMLKRSNHIPENPAKNDLDEINKRLQYAENWARDKGNENTTKQEFSKKQKSVLNRLASELEKGEWDEKGLEQRLYDLGKEEGLSPGEFFKTVYLALLQNERGPRLAPFILTLGRKKIAKILKEV